MNPEQLQEFSENIERLINGESLNVYESGISRFFESACFKLFYGMRDQDIWYDGITEPTIRKRKSRQIEFIGKIWVAKGGSKQWLEPFRALLTDKRITNQGIWLSIDIGEYHAEGDACSL